ncbi:redoxin domain-containing protein [Niabella sp. 22666]|uniref:redoxin domain-containing protein n=1 Tax=Niabella sp. 22666 TaxID=3453954 RepID=UPI003F83058D
MTIQSKITALLSGIALLSGAALYAQSGKGTPFTINGKLTKIEDSAIVYLQYNQDKKAIKDSFLVQNGKFHFKGTIAYPVRAFLVYQRLTKSEKRQPADYLSLYLEKGITNINGGDTLAKAIVTAGPVNKESKALSETLKETSSKISALYEKHYALSKEQREDSATAKQFDDAVEVVKAEQKTVLKAFLDKRPTTIVALDALQQYAGYNPEYATTFPLFEQLPLTVQQSFQGKTYLDRLEKLREVGVGKYAPAFTQADTSGAAVSLASFKGKYVLIDFWASWCGPCRAENPNVVENFEKYKNRNFTVLGVSLDRENAKDKWLQAIHDDKLTWTHVSDLKFWDNEVAKLYGVGAIPQNFLLDPSGKIIAKDLREDELDKKLKEIFN